MARAVVLQALADELAWALQDAPARYALLNTCRAMAFLDEEQLLGKTDGGQWAIDQRIGPPENIAAALATQAGAAPETRLTAAGEEFVRQTAERLAVAARTERRTE